MKDMVTCRYTQCDKLHDSKELPKSEAVQDGIKYYHSDCYHTMQTVNKIRDLFIKEINPRVTGSQVASLLSTVYNIIFKKNVSVDFLEFALEYFIKYKPNKLNHPHGLHYIIQNRDVENAWKKQCEQRLKESIKKTAPTVVSNSDWLQPESSFEYSPQKQKGFADILQ